MIPSVAGCSPGARGRVVARRDDHATVLSHLSKTRDQPPTEVQSHRCPQGLAEGGWDERQDTVARLGRVVGVLEHWAHRRQSSLPDLGGLQQKQRTDQFVVEYFVKFVAFFVLFCSLKLTLL